MCRPLMLYLQIVHSNGLVVFFPRRRWMSAMLGCDSLTRGGGNEVMRNVFFFFSITRWILFHLCASPFTRMSLKQLALQVRRAVISCNIGTHVQLLKCTLYCRYFMDCWVNLLQKHKWGGIWQTGLTWGLTRSSRPTRVPGEGVGEVGGRLGGGAEGQRGEGEASSNFVTTWRVYEIGNNLFVQGSSSGKVSLARPQPGEWRRR